MIGGGRKLANKLWNVSRLLLGDAGSPQPAFRPASVEERWILARLEDARAPVEAELAEFGFAAAVATLYRVTFDDFCDWYAEAIKPRLYEGDEAARATALAALERLLKLLHPVMPHVTEEIWSNLPERATRLIVAEWPEPDHALRRRRRRARARAGRRGDLPPEPGAGRPRRRGALIFEAVVRPERVKADGNAQVEIDRLSKEVERSGGMLGTSASSQTRLPRSWTRSARSSGATSGSSGAGGLAGPDGSGSRAAGNTQAREVEARHRARRRRGHARRRRGLGGAGIPIGGVGGGAGLILLLLIVLLNGGLPGGGSSGGARSTHSHRRLAAGAARRAADDRRPDRVRLLRDQRRPEHVGGHLQARTGVPGTTLRLFSRPGQSRAAASRSSARGRSTARPTSTCLLDMTFFRGLQDRFGAAGDFAQAYVIAHEFGHHVQHSLEIDGQGEDREPAISSSCRRTASPACGGTRPRSGLLEPGDVEEGLDAAASVGDDRIQQKTPGRVDPESWTHGSADQRQKWFKVGFDSGDPTACDTFKT